MKGQSSSYGAIMAFALAMMISGVMADRSWEMVSESTIRLNVRRKWNGAHHSLSRLRAAQLDIEPNKVSLPGHNQD